MEIYSVNLRVQSEYSKIRTRKSFVFGHFSRNVRSSREFVISRKHLLKSLIFSGVANSLLAFFTKSEIHMFKRNS